MVSAGRSSFGACCESQLPDCVREPSFRMARSRLSPVSIVAGWSSPSAFSPIDKASSKSGMAALYLSCRHLIRVAAKYIR